MIARDLGVLAVSSLAYYVVFFGFGVAELLGDASVLVALALFSCAIPFLFGFVTQRLLRVTLPYSPWIVLIVPLLANGAEHVYWKVQTSGAPVEYAGAVYAFWISQALFVLLGAYVGLKRRLASDG